MSRSNDDSGTEELRGARPAMRPSAALKFRSGLTIADLALRKAAATPQRVAVREADGSQTTFAALLTEAQAIAAGLPRLGIQAGDTISFQLPNWREAVAINVAAAMLGLRVNPITPIYRGAELRIILADARSKVLFIPEVFRSINYQLMIDDLRAGLPELRHVLSVRGKGEPERSIEWLRAGSRAEPRLAKVDPNSSKLLLFTSGTTGRAKGVIHSHESMECATMSAVKYWSLEADDVMLMASPVTHITGYAFGLELPFLCDATVLLMERWDAASAVQLIDQVRATASIGATPFLKELIDEAEHHGSRLPSLRLFACGGAAVPPELILRAARVTDRCRAFRVYGATEIPLVTKGFIEANQRNLAAETDGRVVGYDVKIVDALGASMPRGRIGEVRARGPAMLVGYTDPSEFDKSTDEEGFFCTGDLGKLTDDDAIVVTGRLKDIIIRGGENLSPVEIENALERHPAIQEAAVVAMPHPRLGEGVAAFVRAHEGVEVPSLTEIADFLDDIGLARQKFPERVEYVDDFPRTASGKIRKDQLRDALRRPLVISSDGDRSLGGVKTE
jgi:acyl-CoA synthetase (AMP-forming)/AMP-acid ligase II